MLFIGWLRIKLMFKFRTQEASRNGSGQTMENGSWGCLRHLSAKVNGLPSIRGHFILARGT